MVEAVAVCRTECPIRTECLTQALAANEQYGVWGGMTPSQRASLKLLRAV